MLKETRCCPGIIGVALALAGPARNCRGKGVGGEVNSFMLIDLFLILLILLQQLQA
jgi:hypothetical protein